MGKNNIKISVVDSTEISVNALLAAVVSVAFVKFVVPTMAVIAADAAAFGEAIPSIIKGLKVAGTVASI